MHQNVTRALAALMTTLSLTAVVGCSDGESEVMPKLPKRICWGVFTAGEIAPLMPTGKKAEMSSDPFLLNEEMDSATCNLYIDGRHGMLVNAKLLDYEGQVDWAPWDKANPQPIDVGARGLTWGTGAGTHIVCDASKSPADPGKYIELRLSTDRSPDEKRLRAALPGLLQRMVDFAEHELNCS
ncbi:hypothetical protein AB0903_30590 [Streptomyces sp. NPDC048389]|uniref:hypothetical protein n=1 Tax=Streptomyces sp. NPDC048389 TaxID=3154622 RepID=UPI00345458FD